MGLSGRQVRYLWAIGYFKSGGSKGKGATKPIPSPSDRIATGKKVSESNSGLHPPTFKDYSTGDPSVIEKLDSVYAQAQAKYGIGNNKDAKLVETASKYFGDTKVESKYAFQTVNDTLRGKSGLTKSEADEGKRIDSALSKAFHVSEEPMTVYRGAVGLDGIQEGHQFTDMAYTSTTMKPGHAFNFADNNSTEGVTTHVYRISVPKGTKVLAGKPSSGDKGEYEVLLHKGTKYQVMPSKGERISGRDIIDLMVVH